MITLLRTFYDHRIEVLSGISGPTLMTTGINAFVESINRSILARLFGVKPPTPKDDNSYPKVDGSRIITTDENLKERELRGRYDF